MNQRCLAFESLPGPKAQLRLSGSECFFSESSSLMDANPSPGQRINQSAAD